MTEADRFAKRLSNAFRQAAYPASVTVAQGVTSTAASINSGSALVTVLSAAVTGACALWSVNSFAKGLEKPLVEPNIAATLTPPPSAP